MTTESTEGQQPNPGDGDGTADAAKPNGQGDEGAPSAGGKGDGGEAGGDTGEQGKPKEGEDGDGKGDGSGKDGTDKQDEGAPEAYAEFTLPEGFTLEGERLTTASEFFKAKGMSQESAQEAIDLFIKITGEDSALQQQAYEAAVAKQREDWATQAKAELGAEYDAAQAYALTAVRATQSEALKTAFNEHGWGNHPELIKAFAFFGKMMRDSPVDGIGQGGAAPVKQKPWDSMYGDMHNK